MSGDLLVGLDRAWLLAWSRARVGIPEEDRSRDHFSSTSPLGDSLFFTENKIATSASHAMAEWQQNE